MIEFLTNWVAENRPNRYFMVRSRYGSDELSIEVSEGQYKFEITTPLLDLKQAEEACRHSVERFRKLKELERSGGRG